MSKPERPDEQPTQGQMSDWIEDVMQHRPGPAAAPERPQPPLSGPQDLRIPGAEPQHSPQAAPPDYGAGPAQTTYAARPPQPQVNAWGEPVAPPYGSPPYGPANANAAAPLVISPDVAQKRLIAGLLGIFLGGLGIHKFYLGIINPGIIMLAITIGASIFGVLTLIFGIGFFILFLPSLVGLLGFVEGILYLTKSDADFQRDYIDGKKPWL